jgi:hypothetical protein
MYIQFLIEDMSTEILVNHVMEKFKYIHPENKISYKIKSFRGIGHLPTEGKTVIERKTGKLLNDLPMYFEAFDKVLSSLPGAVIILILDNDKRNTEEFSKQLKDLASKKIKSTDYAICIAVKEMEAWLLGDKEAIEKAYPNSNKNAARDYMQDSIDDTWEVLANMIYPGGLKNLKRKASGSYHLIGKAKLEWAERIGKTLELNRNTSPSFKKFINELEIRLNSQ